MAGRRAPVAADEPASEMTSGVVHDPPANRDAST